MTEAQNKTRRRHSAELKLITNGLHERMGAQAGDVLTALRASFGFLRWRPTPSRYPALETYTIILLAEGTTSTLDRWAYFDNSLMAVAQLEPKAATRARRSDCAE